VGQSLFPLTTNAQLFNVKDAYAVDKNTAIIIQYLLYHQPFERATLSSLPAQHSSAIANNKLGKVKDRLVFYKTVLTTVNKIYRIVVPVSLRHTFFLFYLLLPLSVIWGSIKLYIALSFDSSGPRFGQISIGG